MSLSLLFPACALLCGGYFLLSLRTSQSRSAQQGLQGLQDISHLRRLLEALPQHRGMANALLQGDESFRGKLATLQSQIDKSMSEMDTRLCLGNHWGVAVRARHVLDAWSNIKQQFNSMTAPESFGRHTALITELLYLINDVADAAGLLTEADSNARLIDAAINTLPLVTETLGQARGIGTGVAARGKCATDMRVKLRYLLANTRRVADEVGQAVRGTLAEERATQKGTVQETDLKTRAGQALDESQQATQAFLSLLESGIIHDRPVDVAPTDVYAAGTEAIQHSFTLLDAILNSLHHRLSLTLKKNQRRLWQSHAMALALVLPAAYLLQRLFTPL